MINYAPALPNDRNQNAMQELPAPILAKAAFSKENASASSVVSFTHNTTAIEVAAVGGAAVIKWVATTDTEASVVSAASGANFDHAIVTGEVRRFVIPRERQGSFAQSVQGINRAEGLYQRVAFKTVGVASVLLTEY